MPNKTIYLKTIKEFEAQVGFSLINQDEVAQKLKDAWGELKKVTWPTFATVVKKTGIVILVCVIFTVVLFGIDYLLGLLYNLFMS